MSGSSISIPKVKCIKAKERAILCRIEDREVWIPQSQITEDSEVYGEGHEGKLVITEWFAEKIGIHDE